MFCKEEGSPLGTRYLKQRRERWSEHFPLLAPPPHLPSKSHPALHYAFVPRLRTTFPLQCLNILVSYWPILQTVSILPQDRAVYRQDNFGQQSSGIAQQSFYF